VRGIIGTPKSGKARELPLSDDAIGATALDAVTRSLVFTKEDGRMLTAGDCRHPLRRACRMAGIRQVSWHVLRHSFASHLVMRGVALNGDVTESSNRPGLTSCRMWWRRR
jgi:site-specific recombinase XerD